MTYSNVKSCTVWTLLQLREDVSVENGPVWVEELRVLLVLLPKVTMDRLFGLLQQLLEEVVCLCSCSSVWVGVGNGTDNLVVEVLVEAIHVLLHIEQLSTAQIHFHELVVDLVPLFPRQWARALHREVEVKDVHFEHSIVLWAE